MDRESILNEIRRIAEENGGTAPGKAVFEKCSGIFESKWRGKFWVNWSDAVAEAGFTPGKMQEAHAEEHLLKCLAELVMTYGRFPTSAEVRIQRVRDGDFPNHKVFDRLGDKATRIAKLRAFASENPAYASVLPLLPIAEAPEIQESVSQGAADEASDGFVYILDQ